MPFELANYSRRATLPVRQAMVRALARFIGDLTFYNPGAFQFAQVFDEWAGYLDRAVYPSAVVLPPPTPYRYADSEGKGPSLLEDTCEPVDMDGNLKEAGFGLYKLSEFEEEFELRYSTTSPGERDAVLLGLEGAFRSPNILMDDPQGSRNGVMLPLPEYYSRTGRFALTSARVEDDADSAMRNLREAVLTISAQAEHVAVARVYPLDLSIHVTL